MNNKQLMSFKDVKVGAALSCCGTNYIKINKRMGQINEPNEAYNGNKFYFGYKEVVLSDNRVLDHV